MHIQIYRDTAGEWRWHLRAANNETVADSSESYTRKRDALRALNKIIDQMTQLCEIPVIERLK